MAANVIMPALGMAQETGKVLRWLKHEGDTVSTGEPLLEVETDKATVELEAPASGVLTGVRAGAGDVVPVGTVIAEVVSVSAYESRGQASSEPATTAPAPKSNRPPASPKAKRLAREQGVDLSRIAGSGPGGAVVANDVAGAVRVPDRIDTGARAGPPPTHMSTAWRLMAERTTHAWTSVPHFLLLREANASQLKAWREEYRRRFAIDVTYSDLLVKLVAGALRTHPRLNASWVADAIADNNEINIGLAVAVEDGLIVPVIHRADHLGIAEITRRRIDLVTRAYAGKTRPEDLRGGTFTISNLGMYGVDAFTAIINAPQAAILAVGRIAERVVPVDGRPGVQPMLMLSLSCDHRVADGARAAQFLDTLAKLVEEPAGLDG